MVESYSREYAWDSGYCAALESYLGSNYHIEWFEMDTKRLAVSEHPRKAEEAWQKYLALRPDLVILGDDAALSFLGPRFALEKTPVVFLGINANPRSYLSIIPKNMTGVLERPLLKRSLVFINEILPQSRRGLILFDTDLTAQATREFEFDGQDQIVLQGVRLDILLVRDFRSWKESIISAEEKYDYIITGLYQTLRDTDGSYVDPESVIAWSSNHSRVPLFSFWDFGVGADRAIGGRVLVAREMGEEAARIALRVLSGEAPSSIPLSTDLQGVLMFSKTQLEKWNILLPQDIAKYATFVE